ncbi:hypothetical protein VOLN27_89 [Halorubrum virus VOLN27B]|nr:hypothetical protein VOLN27_89 [Halorubrum virus VOLN27B]
MIQTIREHWPIVVVILLIIALALLASLGDGGSSSADAPNCYYNPALKMVTCY